MSSIVAAFNPATANSTEFTAPQSSANGALVFFNESNISLNLTFADGSTMYLPAWYHRHKCGASGSVNVQWEARTVLNSGPPPTSEVIVEAFRQGEAFPADGPLVRQANGEVNSTVTATNQLVNTGNAPGSNILTTNSTSATGNTATATNDGLWTLASTIAGALVTWLQSFEPGAGGTILKLGAASYIAEILGNLQVDGTINTNSGYERGGATLLTSGSDTTLAAPGAGNWIRLDFPNGTTEHHFDASSLTMSTATIIGTSGVHVENTGWQLLGDDGGNTNLGNGSVNTFVKAISQTQFQIAGVDKFDVTSTGPHIPSGCSYFFQVGSLSRQNGAVSSCGSNTSISHGLGVSPAFVLGTPVGGQPFSATVGVGNIGSSTFNATVGSGSQIAWWAAQG